MPLSIETITTTPTILSYQQAANQRSQSRGASNSRIEGSLALQTNEQIAQTAINPKAQAVIDRQQGKTKAPYDGPATFLFPGVAESSESQTAKAWIKDQQGPFDEQGNQRNLLTLDESELTSSAAPQLPGDNPVLFPPEADRVIDKQLKGGGDDGSRTGPPTEPPATIPFQQSSAQSVEKAEVAIAPVENSGPSLALVLSGIGFLASGTVAAISHFTNVFDPFTEQVKFSFDTLTMLSLALLALFGFGGKEVKAERYSEAEG
jgi:hypothetical protein